MSAAVLWEEVVRAEDEYVLLRSQLAQAADLDDQLCRALKDVRGRRLALELLLELPIQYVEHNLKAVFEDATYTHGNIEISRPILRRLKSDVAARMLAPILEQRLATDDEPWEAYLRSAEVLDELGQQELLDKLIERAKASNDPDVVDQVQFMRQYPRRL